MVITPDGHECHTKSQIEHACLMENQAQFNQASNTPLLQPLLYGLLSPLGMGMAAPDILDGKFEYPSHPVIQDMLNTLKHCDPDNSLGPMCIQAADYHNIWQHSKEKTSLCSKYGLHFSHYIAITHDDDLTNFHTQMIDITLMMGYSPTR